MCGSCWAYGAIGPIESVLAIKTGSLRELPEQLLVDCAWTNGTGESEQNSGCDGGVSDIGILEVVRKYGGVIALPGTWRTARPGVIGLVKDQAMCGSGWAYGAIGPVESVLAIKIGNLRVLPEQFLVDCAWTSGTGESDQNSGCDGGVSGIGILAVVRKYGGVVPVAKAKPHSFQGRELVYIEQVTENECIVRRGSGDAS